MKQVFVLTQKFHFDNGVGQSNDFVAAFSTKKNAEKWVKGFASRINQEVIDVKNHFNQSTYKIATDCGAYTFTVNALTVNIEL